VDEQTLTGQLDLVAYSDGLVVAKVLQGIVTVGFVVEVREVGHGVECELWAMLILLLLGWDTHHHMRGFKSPSHGHAYSSISRPSSSSRLDCQSRTPSSELRYERAPRAEHRWDMQLASTASES
jgi:hypothetical protein